MKIMPLYKCLDEFDFEYFFIDTVTSTMDIIKSKIDVYNKNIIILANCQTNGRGRRGEKWISPPGNIYCSLAIKTDININFLYKFGIISCVSVKQSLEYIGLKNILFKWPNDIYCEDKKISGIIQETYYNKLREKYIIVGIGINFQSSPKINNYKVTNVEDFILNIDKNKFFEIFINYILYNYNNFVINNNNDLFIDFKDSQMFINSNIKIKLDEDKVINGKFIGINKDGSLILKTKNKNMLIYSGQIQF